MHACHSPFSAPSLVWPRGEAAVCRCPVAASSSVAPAGALASYDPSLALKDTKSVSRLHSQDVKSQHYHVSKSQYTADHDHINHDGYQGFI